MTVVFNIESIDWVSTKSEGTTQPFKHSKWGFRGQRTGYMGVNGSKKNRMEDREIGKETKKAKVCWILKY